MSFELERFEWESGDRLELAGLWFGVGGRRFLRPTLEVDVDGHTRRLLATLEHKPWAPYEGEEWIAAFEWQGAPAEAIESARLTVGPDMTVELAPPGSSNGRRRSDGGPGRQELAAARAEVERVRAAVGRERDAAVAARGTLATELDKVRSELLEARLRIETLESNLRVASRLRDEAREERNTALESLDAAVAQRDRAVAAREEAAAERDAAMAAWQSEPSPDRGAPHPREAPPLRRETVRPAERPLTGAAAPEPDPAPPTRALAETAEVRFLGYPIRPRGRASEKVRWVARVFAVLSLLFFVAALVALVA